MSAFVSYAQNFEDVMLYRALKHIKKGFYIDVGADDPSELSVTKAFYDRGWRGINMEPVATKHAKFEQDRIHDVNLQLLAAAREEDCGFFEIVETGLSTMDEGIARQHASTGIWEVKEYAVHATSVDNVCDKHSVADVHFLKVDAEGAEKGVIEGMALNKYRPWIILMESTVPLSTVQNYQCWEPLLLRKQYSFVYADGLNRFYIADEHSDLKAFFSYPPNVFDDFICARERHLQAQVAAANEREGRLLHQLNTLVHVEQMLRTRFEKGPFCLRQVVRHPKAFMRETLGLKVKKKPQYPFLAEGFVDEERRGHFSIEWIFRHPGKASSLMVRQTGKVFRFALRHPGKFIFAKASRLPESVERSGVRA